VLVSAELRWFWRDAPPAGLEAWFRSGPYPPGGGTPRTDEYLVDIGQLELGLKRRNAKTGVEVKGLVAVRGTSSAPLEGRVQIWCKWTSEALTIDHLPRVAVHKTRWLRKYDTSGAGVSEVELDPHEQPHHFPHRLLERGCQFELVALRLDDDGGAWWSLGFEAFGELATLEQSLHQTLAHVLPGAPRLEAGLELSYPAWLARLRS
jgi:hypothetical protein